MAEELEGQEGEAKEVPQEQPPVDPRAALEIAAQTLGVSPEYLESSVRLQEENRRVFEENRRRDRELALKEAQAEAILQSQRRFQQPEPQYEVDPAVRPIYEEMKGLKQMILEERQQRQEEERRMVEAQAVGQELDQHFQALKRSLPTQSQPEPERFYGAMQELWPNAEFRDLGISPERAVQITARYMGISNGQPIAPYSQGNPLRNPRAQIVIPGAGAAATYNTASGLDTGPQRPGETAEQYSQRLARVLQESGVTRLPDGKFSSG